MLARFACRLAFATLLGCAAALPALAQTPAPAYPDLKEGDLTIRNFRFNNGQILPTLKLHYMTIGAPHKNAKGEVDNAVLLLHGTTGTGKSFLVPSFAGTLFDKGQPLDAAKYFLIMPDGIGRGGSDKPSDGLRMKFPHYGYLDVVEGQYRVVTEALGIHHLKLVLGTSMGGMQTWLWGELHPDMMDALMPIASQPVAMSGRNWIWRRMIIDAIRTDPDWNNGNYTAEPKHFAHALPIFNIMTGSPVRMQEEAPDRDAANKLYDQWVANYGKVDANDMLYWFESSYDYNPGPDLDRIKARLLAVNFADDQINPPQLGVMEPAIKRIKHARLVLIPASAKTNGHQTLQLGAVWGRYVTELLRSAH